MACPERERPELIRVAQHPQPGANWLGIRNISKSTSYEKLEACCREFGLVDTLVLNQDKDGWWALVQYFSRAEAEDFQRSCDGRLLDSRQLRVSPVPALAVTRTEVPRLRSARAVDMMNHFLGFHRWSHSITKHESVPATQLPDGDAVWGAVGDHTAHAMARVRVVCPDDIAVEREAFGTGSSHTAYEALAYAHKAAVTNALHAALTCLAIVRWPSGKTVVRLLPGVEPG